MRGISPRARDYVRNRATENMHYTCVIERVGASSFDDATSLVTAGDRTVVYAGICRVWEVSGAGAIQLGDGEDVILQNTQISIPWGVTPVPRRDDEVEIVASSSDAALIGKRFRIIDSVKGGDLRATRRFSVQGIQEELR